MSPYYLKLIAVQEVYSQIFAAKPQIFCKQKNLGNKPPISTDFFICLLCVRF